MNLIETLKEVNVEIMEKHPNAFFYEAECVLVSTDDGKIGPEVDPVNTKLVFGTTDSKTIVVSFEADGDKIFEVVPEPWLEDRPFTPYIPMRIEDAMEFLNTANLTVETPVVTLRFALYPGITEPQYIFTLDKDLYASVGVYSGKVTITKQ